MNSERETMFNLNNEELMNSNGNSNDQMVEKLDNNAIHSQPNFNLHRNYAKSTNGLPTLNENKNKNEKNNINDIKNGVNQKNTALKNYQSAKNLKNKIANAALSSQKAQAASTVANSLENSRNNKVSPKQGLAGRLFDKLTGSSAKEKIEETNDGGGSFSVSTKTKKIILATILGPILSVSLILFICFFVVFIVLENFGVGADDAFELSEKVLEEKLNKIDNADDKEINDALNKVLYIENSKYLLKINNSGLNLLSKSTKSSKTYELGFDMDTISSLYPPSSNYANVDYSYQFFYKLFKLNEYYKGICGGKQVLDLPLLMITLKLESDDMARVFASNVGYMGEATTKEIDDRFSEYYKYDYDWSNYNYSRDNSEHDMEILAQHMIKKTNYNRCTYDEEKYKEFLKEFIEKKYYLSSDSSSNVNVNTNSTNNFTKYNLTEDQLLQIASLCAQEQPGVSGAAAEASLMANKFETESSKYKSEYKDDLGTGLYEYVRNIGWWAGASKFMDKRNASTEVVEAVRDVLVNGKRTLPRYVNTHDCLSCNTKNKCPSGKAGDICVIKNGLVQLAKASDINDRSNYISHETKLANIYNIGEYKTFYSFPNESSDPFSYKSEKLRKQYGECHFDFNSKTFVDCSAFADTFVGWLVQIAADDSHGYSQKNRNSLVDFDCSSLVYYGLLNSGFTTDRLGVSVFSTHSERDVLKSLGFVEIEINSDLTKLQKGDILWKQGHTEVYVGEGITVGAHSASNGTAEDNEYGDQNGSEISTVNIVTGSYWQYAYRYEG